MIRRDPARLARLVDVLRIVILVLFPGCLWATTSSDKVYGYEARGVIGQNNRGASAHVMGGMAGLHFEFQGGGRQFERDGDPNAYTGVGLGASLRASPFGIIAPDHRLERFLDLGAEVGADASLVVGVPTTATLVGAGWVGGWVELGTVPVGDGYIALTGNIRTVAATDTWHDQLLLGVGIAFRKRAKVTADDLDFHD